MPVPYICFFAMRLPRNRAVGIVEVIPGMIKITIAFTATSELVFVIVVIIYKNRIVDIVIFIFFPFAADAFAFTDNSGMHDHIRSVVSHTVPPIQLDTTERIEPVIFLETFVGNNTFVGLVLEICGDGFDPVAKNAVGVKTNRHAKRIIINRQKKLGAGKQRK
jgi:hypothetical protein